MTLSDLPPLREVIARHRLSAHKALGQNFLLDGNLLDRIARVPGKLAGATVYEVGPGPGGLTRALVRAGAHVIAVEQDARAIPILEELAAAADGRLSVIHGDALKQDEPALVGGGVHVVANLPYNIGTVLLARWLTVDPWPPWWASLTVMLQKEVALRLVARPGADEYGRLAILAQWRSRPTVAFEVNRMAFVPPPKVTSAVVHITPAAAPEGVAVRLIERVTAAAFGQRRKMLRQSLKGVPGALDALETLGIDATRRGETLTVDDYVAIARLLTTAQSR
jgi:16S rRNA (adenine1518-N6/adenine1519-N6)-dimethyltransferase